MSEESREKPRSARDGEPSPKSPTPARESTSRGSAPTPVRDLMQTAEGEASDAPASPLPPPTVDFEADGEGWEVEVAGRTLSGTRPDSGAPLLLLRFRQAKGAGETPPVREAWAVARSLFDLSPIELAELLSRSRVRGPDRDASGGEEGRRRGRRKAR